LLKFCVKILFFKLYFSPLNTFIRKGKDPDPGGPKDPDPDPQHWMKYKSYFGKLVQHEQKGETGDGHRRADLQWW
jgi:hypothetical protein